MDRLRADNPIDPDAAAEIEQGVRRALADDELWRVHSENEILARYAKKRCAVERLEEIPGTVPPKLADSLAMIGASMPGLVRQYRNRARFRGRLADEVEQLVREACIPLVHNAAVYGYRAGVPDERPRAVWVLASAIDPEAGATLDESVQALTTAFAHAMSNRGRFTGMRPSAGDFNGWYVRQVAQRSYRVYRER